MRITRRFEDYEWAVMKWKEGNSFAAIAFGGDEIDRKAARQSIASYRASLSVPMTTPVYWAQCSSDFAHTLINASVNISPSIQRRQLLEAATHAEAALRILSASEWPEYWCRAKVTLALALLRLGTLADDEATRTRYASNGRGQLHDVQSQFGDEVLKQMLGTSISPGAR